MLSTIKQNKYTMFSSKLRKKGNVELSNKQEMVNDFYHHFTEMVEG